MNYLSAFRDSLHHSVELVALDVKLLSPTIAHFAHSLPPLVDTMVPAMTLFLAAGSATLGVLSHVIMYIKGEWHMKAPLLVKLYLMLVLGTVSTAQYMGNDLASAL